MIRCLGCMKEYDASIDACPHCGYVKHTARAEIYHLIPGLLLSDRYQIGRSVGSGGFGVTYIAWDTQFERRVAVKEYFPREFAGRTAGETRLTVYSGESAVNFQAGLHSFLDEGRKLTKFADLPGIVDVYDAFKANNTGYIIMEFLDGRTVKETLSQDGVFPYNRALQIILTLLASIKAVHKSGLIHRDISPDNVFLTRDGQVKLLDFGTARFAATEGTHSLTVILKHGYAPIEQYQSRGRQGTWTDIYALAAMMYKMLTGITPPDAIERKMQDDIKRPSELGMILPATVENAIMRALNVDIEGRTQTAGDFESALLDDKKQVLRHDDDAPTVLLFNKASESTEYRTQAKKDRPDRDEVAEAHIEPDAATGLNSVSDDTISEASAELSVGYKQKKRAPLIVGLASAAAVIIVVILFILSGGNSDAHLPEQDIESSSDTVAQIISSGINPTDTLPPSPTLSYLPTPSSSPTQSASPTQQDTDATKVFIDGAYVGDLVDDRRSGYGTMTYHDGSIYVGEWKDDMFHGIGTYTYSNGEIYIGEFVDGIRNGVGEYQ